MKEGLLEGYGEGKSSGGSDLWRRVRKVKPKMRPATAIIMTKKMKILVAVPT